MNILIMIAILNLTLVASLSIAYGGLLAIQALYAPVTSLTADGRNPGTQKRAPKPQGLFAKTRAEMEAIREEKDRKFYGTIKRRQAIWFSAGGEN